MAWRYTHLLLFFFLLLTPLTLIPVHSIDIATIPGTGTDGGKLCKIPFTYSSQTLYACTYLGGSVPWCATGGSAANWGQCVMDTPGSFPRTLPTLMVDDSDPSSLPPYNRKDWPHWTTVNCQTTRTRVLVEENVGTITYTSETECSVKGGLWYDFYTAATVTDPARLDIDHMVPLENAHISGGWAWTTDKKRQYANDMSYWEHLIAVGASANRAKGSKPPNLWQPPNTAYRCEYAVRWIAIKGRWDLTITSPEQAALAAMLTSCPVTVAWPNAARLASDNTTAGSNATRSFPALPPSAAPDAASDPGSDDASSDAEPQTASSTPSPPSLSSSPSSSSSSSGLSASLTIVIAVGASVVVLAVVFAVLLVRHYPPVSHPTRSLPPTTSLSRAVAPSTAGLPSYSTFSASEL